MRKSAILALLLFVFGINVVDEAHAASADLLNIAWSPDGTRIAGVYDDGTVAVWAVNTLDEPLLTFEPAMARSAVWTADSRYVVVAGRARDQEAAILRVQITRWDAVTGDLVDTPLSLDVDAVPVPSSYQNLLIFPAVGFDAIGAVTTHTSNRPDAEIEVVGGNTLRLENPNPAMRVRHMAVNPTTEAVAVVYGNRNIHRIDVLTIADGTTDMTFGDVESFYDDQILYIVNDVAWDPTGRFIASSNHRATGQGVHGSVAVYDTTEPAEAQPTSSFDPGITHVIAAGRRPNVPMAWHPTAPILVVAAVEWMRFYDATIDKTLFRFPLYDMPIDAQIIDVVWSPSAEQLALLMPGNVIEIIDTPEFRTLAP